MCIMPILIMHRIELGGSFFLSNSNRIDHFDTNQNKARLLVNLAHQMNPADNMGPFVFDLITRESMVFAVFFRAFVRQ